MRKLGGDGPCAIMIAPLCHCPGVVAWAVAAQCPVAFLMVPGVPIVKRPLELLSHKPNLMSRSRLQTIL